MKTYPNRTLSEFPYVERGIQEIFLDQPHPGYVVNSSAIIPPSWLAAFEVVDAVLERIHNEAPTIQDLWEKFPREVVKLDWWADAAPDNESGTLFWIYLPLNDSGEEIMELFKVDKGHAWMVQRLFHEYFEGELRRIFESCRV